MSTGRSKMKPMNTAVLTTTRSDSHTWNLVYMEMWLRERGLKVINLGSCVPASEVAQACRTRPGMLLVSSINGHGGIEGLDLIREVRAATAGDELLTVIGGKLTTSPEMLPAMTERLLVAGFDAVLTGADALASLDQLLAERRWRAAA